MYTNRFFVPLFAALVVISSAACFPCAVVDCLNSVEIEVRDEQGNHPTSFRGSYTVNGITTEVVCGEASGGERDGGTTGASVGCTATGFTISDFAFGFGSIARSSRVSLRSGQQAFEGDVPVEVEQRTAGSLSCGVTCPYGRGTLTLRTSNSTSH